MTEASRRQFLAGSAMFLVAPLAAQAQQAGRMVTIGILSTTVRPDPGVQGAFEDSLHALGWVRNQNIRIEARFSGGREEALPALATELVTLGVDVLVAWSPGAAIVAKRATTTVPIVFLAAGDPVDFGLVANLARPGGNLTGVSFDATLETYPKGLELLKECVPGLTRVALLTASDPRTAKIKSTMIDAAKLLKLELNEVDLGGPAELAAVVRKTKERGAQALYIWPSGFTFSFGRQLADLALANRLPSLHPFREGALAGALLSYAPSLTAIARRGAVYVDKILRGAKPADLPVEQPTTLELVVNLKTAKVLGLTIPPSLLLRADQVIE